MDKSKNRMHAIIEKNSAAMKKLIAGMLIAGLVAGCGKGDIAVESEKSITINFTNHGNGCWTKVVQIEGHDYIIFISHTAGGIIHAESCPCNKK